MDAAAFNVIFESTVVLPLLNRGFVKRRQNLFFESGEAVLALLRFQGKSDAMMQRTNFILCIRHKFLRELLHETVPTSHVATINDYPIKERPSTLSLKRSQSWRYRPINLGVRDDDYDTFEFGRFATESEAARPLEDLVRNTIGGGLTLLSRLHPEETLRQLKRHGEDAWCERLWIEDYQKFVRARA